MERDRQIQVVQVSTDCRSRKDNPRLVLVAFSFMPLSTDPLSPPITPEPEHNNTYSNKSHPLYDE